MVTLIKDNKIVVCDDKDKNLYVNDGYEVVKKTAATGKAAATGKKQEDGGKAKDDGKKIEGDLENL